MTDTVTEGVAEKVPISTLPPERQQRLEQIEIQTDEVFRLRTQLVQFYTLNMDYLPKVPNQEGKTRRMRLSDIHQLVLNGQIVLDGNKGDENVKTLEDLIDFQNADRAIDDRFSYPAERERQKKLKHLQITVAFKHGLDIYRQLKEQGGAWNEEDTARENNEVRDYYKMRWGELGSAKRLFNQNIQKLRELEDLEDLARSDPDFTTHAEVIRDLEQQRKQIQDDLQTLVEENPECYMYALGLQLKDARQSFDEYGRIVETPYVKSKINHIVREVGLGRPVFIHGELGTGKSELGKHITRTRLSKPHLARWEEGNPKPEDPKEQEAWQARRAEEAEALVISGHRNIEQEQILAARSVRKTEPLSPEEQLSIITQKWQAYKQRKLELLVSDDVSADTAEQLKENLEKERPLFEQAYLEAFKTPVETMAVLAPFLKAQKEGRPVIIDEMTGIPHHVLMMLNDLLLKKPGEAVTPPLPEIPTFTVQEGFCVITTGNYRPEDGVIYISRQPIDAAFLSRFALISYDYLPMSRIFEDPALSDEDKRKVREENELLQMLVARFLNKDLTLNLPEDGLKQIKRLAVVARNLQDVFTGGEVDTAYFANVRGAQVKPQEVLKENVPSIRHLIPVIDHWRRDGFTKPLDYYLFADYVSRSNARPEEKMYIYTILQTQGDFFPEAEGWPLASIERAKVLRFPIEEKMYGTEKYTGRRLGFGSARALRFYSVKDVIEELYGPAPKRAKIPQSYIESERVHKAPKEVGEEQLERLRVLEEINRGLAAIFAAGFPDDFSPHS